MITNKQAISELCVEKHTDPGHKIIGKCEDDLSGVEMIDGSSLKFTFDDVLVRKKKLQDEYDALEYARDRAESYPSVGDQLDMLMKDMKNGTTTHQKACEAVKDKYPKP